jgi:hypothetical protein
MLCKRVSIKKPTHIGIVVSLQRKLTTWQKLVKSEYAKGRKGNSSFKFADALKNAKKVYHKKID